MDLENALAKFLFQRFRAGTGRHVNDPREDRLSTHCLETSNISVAERELHLFSETKVRHQEQFNWKSRRVESFTCF